MNVMSLGLWAHAALTGVVALDSVVPALPSEIAVMAMVTGEGSALAVVGVAIAAAIGAFAGDLTMRFVGRGVRGSRFGRRLAQRRWVPRADHFEELGAPVLVFGRFLPVGRTAAAMASGFAGVPLRRYLLASAAGSVLWSAYTVALGRLGSLFASSLIGQVAIGLGVGGAVTLAAGLAARRRDASTHRLVPSPSR